MLELILLEDEPVPRQELAEFFIDSGFDVTEAATLAEFEQRFDPRRHRIALLDLGLPDGDGAELVRRLRQTHADLGIVVLTARDAVGEKVAGLADGADHYLGKRLDLDELAAIIGALSRRIETVALSRRAEAASSSRDDASVAAPVAGEAASLCWRLRLGPRLLDVPGFPAIELSHQDCLVLRVLMEGAGEIISRRQIVTALGENYLDYDQRRLDTQMRRLRRKVEQVTGAPLPVRTSRNAGYCFYIDAQVLP